MVSGGPHVLVDDQTPADTMAPKPTNRMMRDMPEERHANDLAILTEVPFPDLATELSKNAKITAEHKEQIADYVTKARGLKNTSLRTLTALSKGLPPGPEASMGKLVGAVLQQEAASFAMDLAGASGALLDPEATPDAAAWQERYLSLPGLRIAGGTDEILRNIIAERVMGLPSDARADKGVAFKDIPTGPPQ